MVLWVLHQIQHILPISSYRAAPLLLFYIPSRPGPRTSDGHIIFVCFPQHANFTGPARPTGSIRDSHPEEGAGRNLTGPDALGIQRQIRLPITVDVLTKVQRHLVGSNHPHRQALWAISSMAFFRFFRLRELFPDPSIFNPTTQLTWGNVAIDGHQHPTLVQIHLKMQVLGRWHSAMFLPYIHTNSQLATMLKKLVKARSLDTIVPNPN